MSRPYPTPALSDAIVRSVVSNTPVRLETFRSPPGTYGDARFEGHRVVTNLAAASLPLTIALIDGDTENALADISQVSVRLHPGETILMRARTRSRWTWTRMADCLVATLPVGAVSDLTAASSRTIRLRDGARLHKLGTGLGPLAQAMAMAVTLATSEGQPGADVYLPSLAEAYITGLSRAFARISPHAPGEDAINLDPSDPLLAVCGTRFEPLLPRLREASLRSVSLDELARASRLSRAQFSRDFKAAVGKSASELIRAHRLHLAMRLLRATSMPLAEVALEAGYSDQSHMSRVVRQACGKTPANVRARA